MKSQLSQAFLVSTSAIEAIVSKAITVPSGDNCQPWRFEWDGQTLSIFHLESKARHCLNRGNHASYLSLGMLLEAIRIAASEENLAATDHLVTAAHGEEPLLAQVQFRPGAPTSELAPLLTLRCTDRRLYAGGSVDGAIFQKIEESAKRYLPCRWYFQSHFSDEFWEYALELEEFLSRYFPAFSDLARLIRFSRRSAERTKDGLPWPSLAIRYDQSRALWLLQNPSFWRVLARTFLRPQLKKTLRAQIESSAGLFCFTLDTVGQDGLVSVGKMVLEIWLRLNGAGFGVQPLSLLSLSVYDAAAHTLQPDLPPSFVRRLGTGRAVLARAFGFTEDKIPVWVFRTGRAIRLPDRMRTLRRPTSEVLAVRSKT